MRTIELHRYSCTCALLLLSLIIEPKAHAQFADSLSSHQSTGGALQFQLIGGIGVYYIGEWSSSSSYRVGADASFNHTNSSGTNESNSNYTGLSPSSSSSNPDQTSTSYQISVSGLCINKLAEFAHTSLYCGAGPMVSYSHNTYSNTSTSTSSGSFGTDSHSDVQENRSTIWGLGPIGIMGIRSQLLQHVNLSAEMGISAIYQWTSQSSSSTSLTTDFSSSSSTKSTLKGWSISLSDIRIGVIIVL